MLARDDGEVPLWELPAPDVGAAQVDAGAQSLEHVQRRRRKRRACGGPGLGGARDGVLVDALTRLAACSSGHDTVAALRALQRAAADPSTSDAARCAAAVAVRAVLERPPPLHVSARTAAQSMLCGGGGGGSNDRESDLSLPSDVLEALMSSAQPPPSWLTPCATAEGGMPATQAGSADREEMARHKAEAAMVDNGGRCPDSGVMDTEEAGSATDVGLGEELCSWAEISDALPGERVAAAARALAELLCTHAEAVFSEALQLAWRSLRDDSVRVLLQEVLGDHGPDAAVPVVRYSLSQAARVALLRAMLLPRLLSLSAPAARELQAAALVAASACPAAAADVLVIRLLFAEGSGPMQGDVAARVAAALPADVRPELLQTLCAHSAVWSEQTCTVALASLSPPRAGVSSSHIRDIAAALRASVAARPQLARTQKFGKLLHEIATKLDAGLICDHKGELMELASAGKGMLAKAALSRLKKL